MDKEVTTQGLSSVEAAAVDLEDVANFCTEVYDRVKEVTGTIVGHVPPDERKPTAKPDGCCYLERMEICRMHIRGRLQEIMDEVSRL